MQTNTTFSLCFQTSECSHDDTDGKIEENEGDSALFLEKAKTIGESPKTEMMAISNKNQYQNNSLITITTIIMCFFFEN